MICLHSTSCFFIHAKWETEQCVQQLLLGCPTWKDQPGECWVMSRSHPGATQVLCNVAGMDGSFTTKLKIPLTWLLLFPPPLMYICISMYLFTESIYIVLSAILGALWSNSPTGHLIKISDPEVWVKHPFAWHIFFSLISNLEITLKTPWFRRAKLGWNWFWYFPEEELIVSRVYLQHGRRKERKTKVVVRNFSIFRSSLLASSA